VERLDRAGVPIIRVSGRLGIGASDTLAQSLDAAVVAGGLSSGVVVDLGAVDYVSSAGLRVLESIAARLADERRELILFGLHDSVKLALSFAGQPRNVVIAESEELAVTRASAPAD